MKKIILCIVAACVFGLAANAQLVTSRSYRAKEKAHNVWLDFGPGFASVTKYGGKSGATVLGSGMEYDVKLRWSVPIGSYFGWDIFNMGPSFWTGFRDSKTLLNLSFATGPRLRFEIADGLEIYLSDNFGVGLVDVEEWVFSEKLFGFTNEVSLGIKRKRLSVGVYYRTYPTDFLDNEFEAKSKSTGLKVGFAL